MTRNESSVYSLQSRGFPCAHKLSVLALNEVDSPPCCLGKCGRGGCGNKRREETPYFSFPSPLASHLLLFQCKVPNKPSQHFDATYRNIVGRNMLRAFGHPVATYCDMLCVKSQHVSLLTCLIFGE